jgi:hypothetical protein
MEDFNWSPEWNAKLENVKAFAMNGELGATYFLQM